MAYRIMKNIISNRTKTDEELLAMADVYFAVGRLNKEEYVEIIEQINKKGVQS